MEETELEGVMIVQERARTGRGRREKGEGNKSREEGTTRDDMRMRSEPQGEQWGGVNKQRRREGGDQSGEDAEEWILP